MNFLLKLSGLKSDLTRTMGYLNPALSNLALIKRDWLEIWLG